MICSKCSLAIFVVLFTITPINILASNKAVTGYIERVMLLPDNIVLEAKLDTGADVSSLDAKNIHYYLFKNNKWIEFDIYNHKNFIAHEQYKLLRMTSIQKRSAEGSSLNADKRPVIKMKLCFENKVRDIEVNLVNRENFSYSFLFGREAMQQYDILIDPSQKYLNKIVCSSLTGKKR